MLEFFIVSNCPGKGLYRNGKKAKREYQKYPDAVLQKFQAPREISAAQAYCAEHDINVKAKEWEKLFTAGRMSDFAQKGSLDAQPLPQENIKSETTNNSIKPTNLPLDANVVIFTDGSYIEHENRKKKKQSSGGYAAIIILRDMYDAEIIISGYAENPSDPLYMEMLAVSKALSRLKKYNVGRKVTLYSDSQEMVFSYNKKLEGWEECGWKKADGKYIKHWKLWRKILRKAKDYVLQVHWIKGHAKNKYNKRCDLTAYAEAMMRKNEQSALTNEQGAAKEENK